MRDWPKSTLGEIVGFTNGGAWNQSEYSKTGIPVVRVSDIHDETVRLDECKFLPPASLEKYQKHLLHEGDVVIATVGSHPTQPGSVVGRMARVPRSADGTLLNQNAVRLAPVDSRMDRGYLRYLAVSQPFRNYIIAHARVAANQVRLAISALSNMPIALPPLNIQQTIASILSAYDNLIENNTSRMRILETLSQMIYREWFVNLRFPGHQSVGIVESEMGQIPEGWKATSLGENVSLESGKRPKGGIREETDGVPSIGAENINGIGKHHFENEKLVSRAFYEAMQRGVVRDRDVALYKDGAYIGKSSYFRDGFPHRECCVNEHVFVLRGIGTRLTQNFLYLWLQEPDTVQAIRATNANAAQPGINQQSVNGLDILLPDEEIAARFDRTVEPLLAELVNLAKQNVNLRETRDLLLPKLISGEVSVEHVETESVLESV